MGIPAPGPEAILVSGWLLIAVATAVIIARLYLRLKIQKRKLLVSDILMCGAWVSAVVVSCLNIILAHKGVFEPEVKITMKGFQGDPHDIPFILEIFWVSNIPFLTVLYLAKAALLSMYLQIFPFFMRKRRIFLWATIIYVAGSFVTSILLLSLICLPIQTNWDISVQATCPRTYGQMVFIVCWVLHMVGDLLVFSLPWFVVTGLNMRRPLKIGVYCTFLLGMISIIFDTIRFVTIKTSAVDDRVSISTIGLWSTLDCNICLVIACLPSLRPYFGSPSLKNAESQSFDIRTVTGSKTSQVPLNSTASAGSRDLDDRSRRLSNPNNLDKEVWEETLVA